MSEDRKLTHRTIRSFVIRNGRITTAQMRAYEELWPQYGIDFTGTAIDWDAEFGRAAPLWVEIGFGNGVQTAHLAALYPEINFLGIEVHLPGVGHLLNLAEKQSINNLRLIRHDAVEVLQEAIADASLAQVCLFFPDPWPKKKHHKRRIVQPNFAQLIASKLRSGGRFHLATDWQEYAEWMLETLENENDLKNLAAENGFITAPAYRLKTKFEQRGLRRGHGVWDLMYEK